MIIIDNHIIHNFYQGCQVLLWLSELGSPVYLSSTMKKYNHGRMNLYKNTINKCCNPKCDGVLSPLQTHHIEPIRHNGIDEFINYIVLCRSCHGLIRHNKGKIGWNQEILLKWKFQAEYLIIGKCSDDMPSEEYGKLLRKAIKAKYQYIT